MIENSGVARDIPLFSREAFELVSREWVKIGWNEKYSYTFSWLGRPVIQLPEDLVRTQETIWSIKPDFIVETGVAHGGGTIFYASLCRLMGHGRVIGVDIEVRPENRRALEEHRLSDLITLIEGDSTSVGVVDQVRRLVGDGSKVIVFLDSNHEKQHVLRELELYHEFISPGSYIVATDGIMAELTDVPRGSPQWEQDNPASAAKEFVAVHDNFEIEEPLWPFNESELVQRVTHWPQAWIRRVETD